MELSANSTYRDRRIQCTETVCKGPHASEKCWSKPINFPERDDFLARRRASRYGSNSKTGGNPSSKSSTVQVRGIKKVSPPSASVVTSSLDMMSLHTSFELVSVGDKAEANASTKNSADGVWGLHDTGATHHMFNSRKLFVENSLLSVENPNQRRKLAGGDATLAVEGVGKVRLKAGDGTVFELTQCLLVPDLSKNLIAGGVLKKKGVREVFDDEDPSSFALVKNSLALFNGCIHENGLMNVVIEPVRPLSPTSTGSLQSSAHVCSSVLHRRLGHISKKYIDSMLKHGSLDGVSVSLNDVEDCDVCHVSKNTKLPFNHTRPRALKFLENVHVDISGINQIKSIAKESYYILFCDYYSSYCHIFGLIDQSKSEVHAVFKKYIALVERQTGCKLKQFTLDRGGEFVNHLLVPELESLGVTLHLTAGHTPEQNGVSNRGNQTIITKARCMMLESNVPQSFWFLACSMAVFLTNRCITKSVDNFRTPFEVWYFRKPSIRHLKVFGCQAYQLIRKELRVTKYTPVASPGVLVGYEQDNYNFHIYDVKDRRIYITPHGTFDESIFPFVTQEESEMSRSGLVKSFYFDDDTMPLEPVIETNHKGKHNGSDGVEISNSDQTQIQIAPEITCQTTRSQPRVDYKGMCSETMFNSFDFQAHFSCLPQECHSAGNASPDPKSYKKAMLSGDSCSWQEACDQEMKSLLKKGVWTLVDRLSNKCIICGMWIFQRKIKADGTDKFKARFVALGNTQMEGLEYGETFAPTGKPTSLPLLVAIAAINSWDIHQMDAVTAFLNGILEDEIYIEQPEGYVIVGQENKFLRLNRS